MVGIKTGIAFKTDERRLAQADIGAIKPPRAGEVLEIRAKDCAGLRLRVTPNGKRTWSVVYRVAGAGRTATGGVRTGPPRRVTLGTGELSFREAKRMADEALELARQGVDYGDQRKAKADGRSARSVETLIERFLVEYARPETARKGNREGLARNWLTKPELAAWQGRELSEITRADIHLVLDRVAVERGPAAVIEMRKHLSKFLHWAIDRQLITSNPITRLDRKEVYEERERELSMAELRRVWDAAGELGYPFGPMYRLLILTGQRRAEIGEMERGWRKDVRLAVDAPEAVPAVVVPPSKHKSRRGHTFFLSPQAVAILDDLPDFGGKFLLSSTAGKTPVSGYSKGKARLDRKIAEMGERDGLPPLEHWTVHDIRRSVATRLSEMGVPGEHIEQLLGHSVEKLRRTYNKNTHAAAVRDAMLRWGALWA